VGLSIYCGRNGLTHEILCDRCRAVSVSDPGGDYIAFRRAIGKTGWIKRRGRWFGPCCQAHQLALDLNRTAKARALAP
jgi:hypothetical protein